MNLPDAPIAHEGFFATHFLTASDQDKSKDDRTSAPTVLSKSRRVRAEHPPDLAARLSASGILGGKTI
jgi:hypothetical protein